MHKFYFWNNIGSVIVFLFLAYVLVIKVVIKNKEENFYPLLIIGVSLVGVFIFSQVMKNRAKNKHHKSIK